MSLADQIREIPFDVPPRVVAERIGCKEVYVRVVRQRVRRWKYYSEMNRRHASERYWSDPEKARKYFRDLYRKDPEKCRQKQREWRRKKKAERLAAEAQA